MSKEYKGIEVLFEDESLKDISEDFKSKATVIFETAVAKAVADQKEIMEAEYNEKIDECKKEVASDLEEQVDSYLTYVVEEWMEENEIAVESGIKTEIAEHFMAGMKELFEESYIDVPEAKVDVVVEMSEKIESMETELNEEIDKNIKAEAELKSYVKKAIVAEVTEELADSEKDKISGLVEMVEYDNEYNYRDQVKSIVEAYTKKDDDESDKDGESDDSGDGDDGDKDKDVKEGVNAYVDAISIGSKF